MKPFLALAFLFYIGSTAGWCMELLFRHFTNPERKWINPGFCVGPYVPIYGFGLCILYLLASLEQYSIIVSPVWNKLVLFAAMAVCMTVIEYIAGVLCIKVMKVRLWDYTNMWGNIQGIICPLFSFFWTVLGAVYYFLLHPWMVKALDWLSNNLAFSFFIGVFFGVFIIDVVYSAELIAKIKRFADDNDVIVKYESLKAHIHTIHQRSRQKTHFFFPLRSNRPLAEHLKEMRSSFEKLRQDKRRG